MIKRISKLQKKMFFLWCDLFDFEDAAPGRGDSWRWVWSSQEEKEIRGQKYVDKRWPPGPTGRLAAAGILLSLVYRETNDVHRAMQEHSQDRAKPEPRLENLFLVSHSFIRAKIPEISAIMSSVFHRPRLSRLLRQFFFSFQSLDSYTHTPTHFSFIGIRYTFPFSFFM